jgi:hypothetical protein
MKHQLQGLDIIDKNKKYGFFWATGVGKSLLGLSIINHLFINKLITKPLVICPLTLIEGAWIDDYKKCNYNYKILNLHNYKDIEKTILENDNTLFLINYESFRIYYNQFKNIDLVICDESSKLKNKDSQISKIMRLFSKVPKYFYNFSGTPAPNSHLEYYSQLRCIANNNIELFGRNTEDKNKYWYFLKKHFMRHF